MIGIGGGSAGQSTKLPGFRLHSPPPSGGGVKPPSVGDGAPPSPNRPLMISSMFKPPPPGTAASRLPASAEELASGLLLPASLLPPLLASEVLEPASTGVHGMLASAVTTGPVEA